jgi:hypothetical protein
MTSNNLRLTLSPGDLADRRRATTLTAVYAPAGDLMDKSPREAWLTESGDAPEKRNVLPPVLNVQALLSRA